MTVDLLSDLLAGDTCSSCGVVRPGHHWPVCHVLRARRPLWDEGWVDLARFGLPGQAVASPWPETRIGGRIDLWRDSLGRPGMLPAAGPLVRSDEGDASGALGRAAALAALVTLRPGLEPHRAAAAVVHASPASVAVLRRPSGYHLETLGCGRPHRIRVVNGRLQLIDHHPTSSVRTRAAAAPPADCDDTDAPAGLRDLCFHSVGRSTISCEEALARWTVGAIGAVPPAGTPSRADRLLDDDEAMIRLAAPILTAWKARVIVALAEAGAADRWLDVETRVANHGRDPKLCIGRAGPMCLVTAGLEWFAAWDPVEARR